MGFYGEDRLSSPEDQMTIRAQQIHHLAPGIIRTDGGTQPRCAIYQNVVDDYAAAVSEGATFPPVVVFYDGDAYWLADGFHRVAAYMKANAENIPAEIRQGTRRDAILHSVGANHAHGLRRTNEDKRRAVMTLLNDAQWSKWPQPDIAKHCGVSREFVNRLSAQLAPSSDRSQDTVREVTRNGTTYTMDTSAIGKPPVQAFDPAQAKEIIDQAKAIAGEDNDSRHDLSDFLNGGEEADIDRNFRAAAWSGNGNNEWHTPAEYIAMARTVLGGIDIDPASNEIAQRTVKAVRCFTKEDDGLTKEWKGRVWMNPPYSQPLIAQFADKLIAELAANRTTAAIVLTNSFTDTRWFHVLEAKALRLCFTKGRVKFESPLGEFAAPTQGQCFFYFGEHADRFAEVFGSIGFIR
jgi:hypothetical protein